MGMSPDGHLLFGVYVGEDRQYPWLPDYDDEGNEYDEDYDVGGIYEGVDELGEYLALKAGHVDPWKHMPEGYSYKDRHKYPEFDKATDEWQDIKRAIEDAAPIEIVYAGYHDYAQVLLALKGTHVYAYGYGVDEVDLEALMAKATPEKIQEAKEFCEANGLTPFEDPKWLLTSSYG